MLTAIWTSPDTAEIWFLVAVILAFLTALILGLREPVAALLPAAVGFVALGLLAL